MASGKFFARDAKIAEQSADLTWRPRRLCGDGVTLVTARTISPLQRLAICRKISESLRKGVR